MIEHRTFLSYHPCLALQEDCLSKWPAILIPHLEGRILECAALTCDTAVPAIQHIRAVHNGTCSVTHLRSQHDVVPTPGDRDHVTREYTCDGEHAFQLRGPAPFTKSKVLHCVSCKVAGFLQRAITTRYKRLTSNNNVIAFAVLHMGT